MCTPYHDRAIILTLGVNLSLACTSMQGENLVTLGGKIAKHVPFVLEILSLEYRRPVT